MNVEINNSAVRKKGLTLAHHYAAAGSESAIQWLLQIYMRGYCGIDRSDPENQVIGFELAKKFAHRGSVVFKYFWTPTPADG